MTPDDSTAVAQQNAGGNSALNERPPSQLAVALIASNGDLELVCERLNAIRPAGTPEIRSHEVLQSFIEEIATSIAVQNSVKGLVLLQLLQVLATAKDQFAAASAEMSAGEITRTIQMVVEGVAALLPPPAAPVQQGASTTVQILNQMGAEQARGRVEARLKTYARVEEQYGEPILAAEAEDPRSDKSAA